MESQSDHDASPWAVELGRRLCAAYVSYNMHLSGVDYALKRYVTDRPGEYWITLAREVSKAMETSGEGPEAKKARAEKFAKEFDERFEKLMDDYLLFVEEYRAKRQQRPVGEEYLAKHPEHEPFERLKVFDVWVAQKIAGLQLVVEKIPFPPSKDSS